MFLQKLAATPSQVINSKALNSESCLLTIPERQRRYVKLTQNEHFFGKYVLAPIPTDSSAELPATPEAPTDILTPTEQDWFVAGWIGILDYPSTPKKADTPSDHCWFRRYEFSILIDPDKEFCVIQAYNRPSDSTIQQVEQLLLSQDEFAPAKSRTWQPLQNKDTYIRSFNAVQSYLRSGDCYQINLTTPFYCSDNLQNQAGIDLLTTFNAAHGCIIREKHRTIFSVSPERLLKVTAQRTNRKHPEFLLEARPIKGTAPRGESKEVDEELAKNLTASIKNQAENLMIVDLLRNDLSVYAASNSVRVTDLFKLESHLNVHHLVSTITATLREDASPRDAINAAFPGGSITGAPKIRAMEIIHELEPQPRGAYCGSAGYLDDSGNCDFNILIRTIEAKDSGAVCWGGGGVVIDSTGEEEYAEIHSKVDRILSTPL